jgi:hypothetical protein
VAFGVGALELGSDGGVLLHLTVMGAILVFFFVAYLWWKLLGAVVRFTLLVLALAAVFVLLRSMGALG